MPFATCFFCKSKKLVLDHSLNSLPQACRDHYVAEDWVHVYPVEGSSDYGRELSADVYQVEPLLLQWSPRLLQVDQRAHQSLIFASTSRRSFGSLDTIWSFRMVLRRGLKALIPGIFGDRDILEPCEKNSFSIVAFLNWAVPNVAICIPESMSTESKESLFLPGPEMLFRSPIPC